MLFSKNRKDTVHDTDFSVPPLFGALYRLYDLGNCDRVRVVVRTGRLCIAVRFVLSVVRRVSFGGSRPFIRIRNDNRQKAVRNIRFSRQFVVALFPIAQAVVCRFCRGNGGFSARRVACRARGRADCVNQVSQNAVGFLGGNGVRSASNGRFDQNSCRRILRVFDVRRFDDRAIRA